MSRGSYPLLLMLAMGLPTAARAIGLGDIHIDSALNEPLSAQIDIVGASRDELIALTAKVASQEIFQRYGLDRPTFLTSATFKVGIDGRGKPVLKVQSSQPFTDPLVGFVVDLRWDNGELIREYSLLLDPAGFSPAKPAAAPVVAAPNAPATDSAQPTNGATAIGQHYRVAARDTLRGLTRRIRPGSESHTQRTMIAIFKSNPHAFAGNINLVLRGTLLRIPSEAEVAAVGSAEAKREVRTQMTAWRLKGRPDAPAAASISTAAAPVAANSRAANQAAGAAPSPAPNAGAHGVQSATPLRTGEPQPEDSPSTELLKSRVQSLEQAIGDVRKQIASETAEIDDLKQLAARPPAAQPPVAAPSRVPLIGNEALLGSLAAGLTLLLAGFAYVRRRLSQERGLPRPTVAPVVDPHFDALIAGKIVPPTAETRVAAPAAATRVVAPEPEVRENLEPADRDETNDYTEVDIQALEQSYLAMDKTVFMRAPDEAIQGTAAVEQDTDTVEHESAAVEQGSAASEQDTAILDQDTAIIDANTPAAASAGSTVLDYNLHNLDATAQHVQMSSQLEDRTVIVERRKNVADVLKTAIERDPSRRDLRMKLLETYYSAASTNQRAFLDAVRQLSRQRELLSEDEWNRVTMMGRTITPDDILFADQSEDDDLADCA